MGRVIVEVKILIEKDISFTMRKKLLIILSFSISTSLFIKFINTNIKEVMRC